MSFQADRRDLLKGTGLGLVGGALGAAMGCHPAATATPPAPPAPSVPSPSTASANLAAATRFDDWASIRDQFNLSRDYIHLALLYLASHPKPVRDAIERHRQGFDQDPVGYLHTPMSESLSSGLVCFEVKNMPATDVIKRLSERKIIASVTPYSTKFARFSTALLNTPADIDTALGAVRALA